jgi:hypothetical protein
MTHLAERSQNFIPVINSDFFQVEIHVPRTKRSLLARIVLTIHAPFLTPMYSYLVPHLILVLLVVYAQQDTEEMTTVNVFYHRNVVSTSLNTRTNKHSLLGLRSFICTNKGVAKI